MGSRTELQTLLEDLLGSDAVYFQPPPSIRMKYPCIVYARTYINTKYADNSTYSVGRRYSITVIDANPDSVIPDKVAALPQCGFDRHYTADNLNHDIFNLYF